MNVSLVIILKKDLKLVKSAEIYVKLVPKEMKVNIAKLANLLQMPKCLLAASVNQAFLLISKEINAANVLKDVKLVMALKKTVLSAEITE